MADEELYPNTELSTDGLSGNVNDLRENDTAEWYTADDPDSGDDVSAAWGMDEPGADLDGVQPVRLYVRHTGNGTEDVSFELELGEDGSTVDTVFSGTVSANNTDGSEFSGSFDPANLSDPNAADMFFSATNTGGMPGTRDVAEIAFITWDADYNVFVDVETLEPSNVSTDSATLEAEVSWQGDDLTVYFEWKNVDDADFTQTPEQNFTETGDLNVNEDITDLNEAEEHQYRVIGERDSEETDQGDDVFFFTHLQVSGQATLDGDPVEDAKIKVINDTSESVEESVFTNGNGDYSVEVPGSDTYHVLGQYEDSEGNLYNEESKPFTEK